MAVTSNPFVKSRVGQVLLTMVTLIITLGKLPFWLILAIPPRWRQHPHWTYRQAILQRLMRVFIHTWSVMEIPTAMRYMPAEEKERFELIQPAEKHLYREFLANKEIQPTTVGATWFPHKYDFATGSGDLKKLVLYFHGGAYVMGEGRTYDAGFPCAIYAKTLDAHVLSVSYRLACNPKGRFPTALQDAVTAYDYLLSRRHVPADRIILAGDSCGANLAIALLRYIADNEGILAPPSDALLFSPWVDLASSLDPSLLENHCHYPTDYVPGSFTAWGARAYIPPDEDATRPYFSPLGHPFCSRTPIFVCVGSQETLYDSGLKFAQQMAAMAARGDEVVGTHVEPKASHAFLNVGNMTGFEDSARKGVQAAKEWMESRRE